MRVQAAQEGKLVQLECAIGTLSLGPLKCVWEEGSWRVAETVAPEGAWLECRRTQSAGVQLDIEELEIGIRQ